MTTFSSAARGCTCGVLKPQGERKPIVTLPEEPTSAGKVEWSARTVRPPKPETTPSSGVFLHGSSKEKTRSSLVRRLSRSTEERARTRDSKSDCVGTESGVLQVRDEDAVDEAAEFLYVVVGDE